MSKEKFIGVFDSGFGGINILKGLVAELPEYDYLYLGDTARTPYGNRSQEVIYEFTTQALDFMFAHNCELVILACNTASAEALRKIQQDYLPKHYPDKKVPKKVLGVLIPGVQAAVKQTKNNKIGVMATDSTVNSNAFVREITKLNPEVEVYQQACPLLVPIVEAGEQTSPGAKAFLESYLHSLMAKSVDTLVLGCTHYGILENQIQSLVGPEVKIISEAQVVAEKLADYLNRHPELEQSLTKNSQRVFYSTDLTDKFIQLGSQFFGQEINVKKAELN